MTFFLIGLAVLLIIGVLWWFTRSEMDGGFWLFLAVALPSAACAAAELLWAIAQILVRALL